MLPWSRHAHPHRTILRAGDVPLTEELRFSLSAPAVALHQKLSFYFLLPHGSSVSSFRTTPHGRPYAGKRTAEHL